MKIALICPSNRLYMPYVNNYEQILIEQNIDYELINWDRFQMEEISASSYRDKKRGHQRSFFDYLKFKKFLLNQMSSNHYDKVIIFGIQLSYFLKETIKKNYKEKYIIDIRDHNKILNFFNIKEFIECSAFTVLSSPKYTEWLPKSDKYVFNHNTQISSINELKEICSVKEEIRISNIGALTEFQMNIAFINSLKNNPKFKLNYHGEGEINKDIISYKEINDINNVFVTGRYFKEDEEELYESSDLINVLRSSDGINNKTALPNRLYNAILYGKPLLSFEGSYISELVSRHHIGIVIKSFSDMEQTIINYFMQFDAGKFNEGRENLLAEVMGDNVIFKEKLKVFLSSK